MRTKLRGSVEGVAVAVVVLAAGCWDRPQPLPDGPTMQISETEVRWETVEGASDRLEHAVEIRNQGEGTLAIPSATVRYSGASGWLEVEVGGSPGLYHVTVRGRALHTLPSSSGIATVTLDSPGAGNSPVTLAVFLSIHEATTSWRAGAPADLVRRAPAVAMPDGTMLLVGGNQEGDAIQRLDPDAGTWSAAGTLPVGRERHTATLLTDGRVLVANGISNPSAQPPEITDGWEIYDPERQQVVQSGTLLYARNEHTAVLLLDGRVLLVGGWRYGARTRSEVFDPDTGTSIDVGAPVSPPHEEDAAITAAARLADGRVLTCGAWGEYVDGDPYPVDRNGCALFDPSANAWSPTGSMTVSRYGHALVALPDGSALAIGGWGRAGIMGRPAITSVEWWSPTRGGWAELSDLRRARAEIRDAAVLLSTGQVLIAGGCTGYYGGRMDETCQQTSTIELAYHGTLMNGTLAATRWGHTVTRLADGTIAVTGGEGWQGSYDGTLVPIPWPELWREPSR